MPRAGAGDDAEFTLSSINDIFCCQRWPLTARDGPARFAARRAAAYLPFCATLRRDYAADARRQSRALSHCADASGLSWPSLHSFYFAIVAYQRLSARHATGTYYWSPLVAHFTLPSSPSSCCGICATFRQCRRSAFSGQDIYIFFISWPALIAISSRADTRTSAFRPVSSLPIAPPRYVPFSGLGEHSHASCVKRTNIRDAYH